VLSSLLPLLPRRRRKRAEGVRSGKKKGRARSKFEGKGDAAFLKVRERKGKTPPLPPYLPRK